MWPNQNNFSQPSKTNYSSFGSWGNGNFNMNGAPQLQDFANLNGNQMFGVQPNTGMPTSMPTSIPTSIQPVSADAPMFSLPKTDFNAGSALSSIGGANAAPNDFWGNMTGIGKVGFGLSALNTFGQLGLGYRSMRAQEDANSHAKNAFNLNFGMQKQQYEEAKAARVDAHRAAAGLPSIAQTPTTPPPAPTKRKDGY